MTGNKSNRYCPFISETWKRVTKKCCIPWNVVQVSYFRIYIQDSNFNPFSYFKLISSDPNENDPETHPEGSSRKMSLFFDRLLNEKWRENLTLELE